MKWIFTLCFFWHGILQSQEMLKPQAAINTVFDKQKNPLLTSFQRITPKVNVITGEYVEEECDLIVAGSEPLSLRRFYGHHSYNHPCYNYWRFNPEHYCVGNLEWNQLPQFVAVGEEEGNITRFDGKSNLSQFCFNIHSQKNLVHAERDGKNHPLNTRISFFKTEQDRSSFHRYKGEIIDGKGGRRTFLTDRFSWAQTYCISTPIEDRPADFQTEYVYPEFWTPFEMPIIEERKPNGNILCYTYETIQPIEDFPGFKILKSMTAYNASRTKILGSLSFNFRMFGYEKTSAEGFEVKGSDGRSAKFVYEPGKTHGGHVFRLSTVSTPNKPLLIYGYDKDKKECEINRINQIILPQGRVFKTDFAKQKSKNSYNPTSKVVAQYAPVGSKGEMCPIATYTYGDFWTQVLDAEQNKTIYRYDSNQRITAIEIYDQSALYRIDRFYWNTETGCLLTKTSEDAKGKIVLKHTYKYDQNYNPIEEKVGDDESSYTVYRTYSTDGFNLKLSEWDDLGKRITYSYLPATNLLSSEFFYEGARIRKRKFLFYDDCATCIKTIIDDGNQESHDDLTEVTFRKIQVIYPRQSLPCFGLPEIIEEKTINAAKQEILLKKTAYAYASSGKILKEDHYDSKGQYAYSILNEYDARERLISTTDALGQKITFTYDENDNVLSQTGPGAFKKMWQYDLANRPIKEIDQDGVTTQKSYDKLGRVITLTDPSSFVTTFKYDGLGRVTRKTYPDGALEAFSYNELGAVIKETDANGFETIKNNNFRGQPTSIHYPDGTQETFTYRSDGKILSTVDKNGAKKVHTYDVFGNVIEEKTLSLEEKLLRKTKATYSAFAKTKQVDPMGVETVFFYDFANRKIKEVRAQCEINYHYDSFGRVHREHTRNNSLSPQSCVSDTIVVTLYDFLNRLIEKRIENDQEEIVHQENYTYDPLGNRTAVITSKGITETSYNGRGEPLLIKDALGHLTTITYQYHHGLTKITTLPNGIREFRLFDSRAREKESHLLNVKGEMIQKTEWNYDGFGNLVETKEQVFEGTIPKEIIVTCRTYGPCNHLLSLLESCQKITRYTYDSKGRLHTLIKPDGTIFEHTYDELGRLVRFLTPDVDLTYEYNGRDQVVCIYDAVTKTKTERNYDSLGNLEVEKLANGLSLSSRFDFQNRRIQISFPDGSKATYSYGSAFLKEITWKDLIYAYEKRDLEGCILQTKLPCQQGFIHIKRDALSRLKTLATPFFKAEFPDNAYDGVGNLCNYSTQDTLGKADWIFTYDDLNQLTSENQHVYFYNSLQNRLKKDDKTFTFNALSQIINPGFTYDPNGNILKDTETTFFYDHQDRLIRVKKGVDQIDYTYDPFHRRLSGTFFKNGTKVKKVNYLWDGDNEIGLANEKLELKEVRILGEGLGAEIGAAVFCQLNGRLYIPIHNHQGSLVTLIDCKSQKPVETCRYTAFGEELTTTTPLSPWRFASKRFEVETGLFYFGRRYYSPALGRWMTPDPQGFRDGPNLYAYVHNNPLTHIDLYGLRGILNDLFDAFRHRQSIDREPIHKVSCGHSFTTFEDNFKNKSKLFEIPGIKIPHGCVMTVNGMNNSPESAEKNGQYLSNLLGGVEIKGIYLTSESASKNLYHAFLNVVCGKMTPPCELLANSLNDYFKTAGPNDRVLLYSFSQGTAIVRNTLAHYDRELRKKVVSVSLAPSAYVDERLCLRAVNYRSARDFVPFLDIPGRLRCKENTVVLTPHKDAPFLDHQFQSPTYEDIIINEFQDYKK